MKFNLIRLSSESYRVYHKFSLAMKLTIILLIIALTNVNAAGYGQKITLAEKDAPLIMVLKQIRQQSGYNFIYNKKSLKNVKNVNINVTNADIDEVLKACFAEQPLTYVLLMKTVVIKDYVAAVEKEEVRDKKINGTVTDAKGDPLEGVSVKLKSANIGTATNSSGHYELIVPENSTLIFTYVGYQTREIAVGNKAILNVTLEATNTSLNEVVVTALGIERQKKTLTYSTQSVNTEELAKSRDLNIMNSLQGKVAGLNIGSGSSGIGAPSRVILRGNRSINGSSQPLYVIDGVPVRGEPEVINPDNIVSINILKGANAAALYGSSGQNGVIVMETKKGKQGFNVGLSTTYMAMDAIQSIPFQYQYGQGAGGIYNKASEDAWGPLLDGKEVPTWSSNPTKAGTTYPYRAQDGVKEGIFQTGYNSAIPSFTNFSNSSKLKDLLRKQ